MEISEKVARSAVIIMVVTMLSKFLGFFREILIAAKYGSGMETDAYFIAITACTIVISIVGAALKTTLIPIFSEIETKMGVKHQKDFSGIVFILVLLVTVALIIPGIFFAPFIVRILASGFEGEQFDLAVKLTRIGYPMIIFLSLSFVLQGFLNSHEKFFIPAVVGIPMNLVYIIFLLFFADQISIVGLMITAVIAGFFQLLVQAPLSIKLKIGFTTKIKQYNQYITKILILMVPVLIGTMSHHVNTIIDKRLASTLQEGSISALNYATKMNSLFLSVFVVAIITVIFPLMSKEHSKQDKNSVVSMMTYSVNSIIIIILPVTIGIFILAQPIISIFFERGAFDSQSTEMAAVALRYYSIGLLGFSLKDILSRVFYSMQDTKTPMIFGIVAVLLNIILNYILIIRLAHGGLALATSLSGVLASLMLLTSLKIKMGHINGKKILKCVMKAGFSATVMGIVVSVTQKLWLSNFTGKFIYDTFILSVIIFIGFLVYMGINFLIKTEEIIFVSKRLKEKFIKRQV